MIAKGPAFPGPFFVAGTARTASGEPEANPGLGDATGAASLGTAPNGVRAVLPSNRHGCGGNRQVPGSQRWEKAPQNLGDVDSVSPHWTVIDGAMSKHGVQNTSRVVGKIGRQQ